MTLLESMKVALQENGKKMLVTELTDYINSNGLFTSKGGKPIPTWRVMAAARKYRATFVLTSDSISL